jgi:hypothetical protein
MTVNIMIVGFWDVELLIQTRTDSTNKYKYQAII